jgi:hypothetical protein
VAARAAELLSALLRTVCESVVFETKVVRILTHFKTRVSLVNGRAWGGTRTGVMRLYRGVAPQQQPD